MNQENANFVRQLMAVQQYPDLREYPEGPPDQPYDISGWTLPFQMDLKVIEAAAPLTDQVLAAMSPVQGEAVPWDATVADAAIFDSPPGVGFNTNAIAAGITPPPGGVMGNGPALIVDMAQNNSFRAVNRAWSEGGRVRFQPGNPGRDGAGGTSGKWVISNLSGSALNAMVDDYALQAERGSVSGTLIRQPRIGLYRPWRASMDEGWTRWLLEQYGFDFTSVYNHDVVAGDLHDRYDVIVISDMSGSQITEGFAKGSVPPRYAGGIGNEGVRALDEYVRSGGTLVTWNSSSVFAVEALHLPVKNVVESLPRSEFFLAGSIVAMTVDPSQPVMTGMPERSKVFVARSPVFTVEESYEGSVLAKYQNEGSPLLSGYLLGEEHLHGFASALDVRYGNGHVILLGMRPQWRGQPFGNFRIVFNAALYSSVVAELAPGNEGFWTAPEGQGEEGESSGGGRGNRGGG
jgi:hypothetical protein